MRRTPTDAIYRADNRRRVERAARSVKRHLVLFAQAKRNWEAYRRNSDLVVMNDCAEAAYIEARIAARYALKK